MVSRLEKNKIETSMSLSMLTAPIDHIIKVLWILHCSGILHIELDPVFDRGLHLSSVVICYSYHIRGKVYPMNINPVPDISF